MRAGIIIYNPLTDKILLIHRWKAGRDYYVIPGGTIEAGETPVEAARREIREELGYHLTASQLQPAFACSNLGRQETYFFAKLTTAETPAIAGEEKERSSAANIYRPQWLDRQALPQLNLQPRLLLTHLQDFLAQLGLKN